MRAGAALWWPLAPVAPGLFAWRTLDLVDPDPAFAILAFHRRAPHSCRKTTGCRCLDFEQGFVGRDPDRANLGARDMAAAAQ